MSPQIRLGRSLRKKTPVRRMRGPEFASCVQFLWTVLDGLRLKGGVSRSHLRASRPRGNVPGFVLVGAELLNVRFLHKADVLGPAINVCFWGESRHHAQALRLTVSGMRHSNIDRKRTFWSPLMTQSGHRPNTQRPVSVLTLGLSQCGFAPVRCPVLSLGGAMRRCDLVKTAGQGHP